MAMTMNKNHVIQLIEPAPHILASREFNIASLKNLFGLSVQKSKTTLAPALQKSKAEPRDFGLMAVLEYKLGNHKQAREYSKIAYELCDKDYPLWVANNEGNFIYSIDEENKKAIEIWDKTGKNYQQIFGNPQPVGLIKDRHSSFEYFQNDEVPLMLPPDFSGFILSAPSVKIIGESIIEHSITETNPNFILDYHYTDSNVNYNYVHVGEAIISHEMVDYLGGADTITRCLDAGRVRHKMGSKLLRQLLPEACDDFSMDLITHKVDEYEKIREELYNEAFNRLSWHDANKPI